MLHTLPQRVQRIQSKRARQRKRRNFGRRGERSYPMCPARSIRLTPQQHPDATQHRAGPHANRASHTKALERRSEGAKGSGESETVPSYSRRERAKVPRPTTERSNQPPANARRVIIKEKYMICAGKGSGKVNLRRSKPGCMRRDNIQSKPRKAS